MKHPTKPGQKCRIVGSWALDTEGVKGPNHGKEVVTVRLHQMQAADRVPVWRITGKDLVTSGGVIANEIDALNYWLEVIDEVEPPKVMTTEKETTA